MPAANVAPFMPNSGIGPSTKIRIGSKIILYRELTNKYKKPHNYYVSNCVAKNRIILEKSTSIEVLDFVTCFDNYSISKFLLTFFVYWDLSDPGHIFQVNDFCIITIFY